MIFREMNVWLGAPSRLICWGSVWNYETNTSSPTRKRWVYCGWLSDLSPFRGGTIFGRCLTTSKVPPLKGLGKRWQNRLLPNASALGWNCCRPICVFMSALTAFANPTIRLAAVADAEELARLSGQLGYPTTAEETLQRLRGGEPSIRAGGVRCRGE